MGSHDQSLNHVRAGTVKFPKSWLWTLPCRGKKYTTFFFPHTWGARLKYLPKGCPYIRAFQLKSTAGRKLSTKSVANVNYNRSLPLPQWREEKTKSQTVENNSTLAKTRATHRQLGTGSVSKKQNKTKNKKQNKTKQNKNKQTNKKLRIKGPTWTFPTISKRFQIKITDKQTA